SNSHEALRPASVTKVMTILLAYEAVRDGKASMEDMVTVSENAAGYGGSTILLEAGESIALSNLIKGMCVASGNDAAIATAEYIGGSQDGFVEMMNARAKELGMNDTHFVNPCGLDADGHVTSAYDIALMSRELINNFPEVFEYTTIWHEMMPHQEREPRDRHGQHQSSSRATRDERFKDGIYPAGHIPSRDGKTQTCN
ncbi:MAG: D-alanyl-D-alanine carboxypeptidase family protein, partial [Bianqueaceae bacterium]